jgi:N-acetyl-gamma-glutamyl-phosphate reductase
MILAGLYGGRGYVARELARLLIAHPQAEIAWWHSREAGSAEEAHRNLMGTGLRFVSGNEPPDADVAFICAPVGVAMDVAPALLERGVKVVAMAADFRLKDQGVFERVYGTHRRWELVKEAVYGIPELHREAIHSARLIANPGCFSSAAILALAPLIRRGGVDVRRLVVDGISGTSGAGAGLDRSMHHPEMWQTVLPYNVVDHRHSYEMESQLSALAGEEATVHFTSYYGCFGRGILAACHAFPEKLPEREALLDAYEEFYAGHPFVRVNRLPRDAEAGWNYAPYPSVADVAGSNYCQIGLDVDERRGRIVVFSAIDNMGKGACGAAVQNMNLMFDLVETVGLTTPGLGI